MKKIILLFAFIFGFFYQKTNAQNSYFPPLTGDTWDVISPASLGWCEDKIDSLYSFLDKEETKGFLVLKDGKIVLEKYFGTFTKDSLWYWASAGKSLTAFMIGQAKDEGLIKLSDTVSNFLGQGWTSCTQTQEEKINIKHLLTMTSGLNDLVADNSCTLPSCLTYKADAGTRWAYHTGAYTQLQEVLKNVSGVSENIWIQNKIKSKTGMTGLWVNLDYNHLYISNARSFARFGILMMNKGKWNNDLLLQDSNYYNEMIKTSQNYNQAYGYLWWLNNTQNFMLPGLQTVFQGNYAPAAPKDMYAALGKNGQILSIVPSQNLILVRMGNYADNSTADVPAKLCNNIWEKFNEVICNTSNITPKTSQNFKISVYPNPVKNILKIEGLTKNVSFEIIVLNMLGQKVLETKNQTEIDLSKFEKGIYQLQIFQGNKFKVEKIIKE